MNPEIIVIAHNLRSCQNVGSLLRTADGLAVKTVYLSGYTPYPSSKNDERLPYLKEKIDKRIKKTSLGAENFVDWKHSEDIIELLNQLRLSKYQLVALEQAKGAIDLNKFTPSSRVAVLVGREVEGVESSLLELIDNVVSIPMLGKKESFNVSQAAAMAIYKLRYF